MVKGVTTIVGMFSWGKRSNIGDHGTPNVAEWELRPGGMLVQKRNLDTLTQNSAPAPSSITVKVKYGSSNHEIRISSHASFAELKKMLAEHTGLHPQDQKLIFKNRERDSKLYLDDVRVKDGSKMVLLEDTLSRERRTLENLKLGKKEKTSKSLQVTDMEIEKLAKKVATMEAAASTGGIIAELEVESATESLMAMLVTLDEISAEGELKLQRIEQVRKVRKHIETLDKLKVHCGGQKEHMKGTQGNTATEQVPRQQQPLKYSDSVVVTTKWETFD